MNNKATRISRWVAANGLFSFIAWKGTHGSPVAENAFVALLWIFVALGFLEMRSDDIVKSHQKAGRAVPLVIDIAYDLAMIAILAWFGWYWSAFGMLIIMATSQAVYEKEFP
jgi:hypothetical protein